MTHYKVGYLIGSLATRSINRKLAKALIRLAPQGLEFSEISFKDLPLYSYDYDDDYPAVARAFKQALTASDAMLFVTPEYNRSIPGGLKNAIDWASRPYGTNAFARKPSAVIGTTIGPVVPHAPWWMCQSCAPSGRFVRSTATLNPVLASIPGSTLT